MFRNKKLITLLLFSLFFSLLCSVSLEDLQFCYERELWDLLTVHEPQLMEYLLEQPRNPLLYDILEDLTLTRQDTLAYANILEVRIENKAKLNDVFRLLALYREEANFGLRDKQELISQLKKSFSSRGEQLLIDWMSGEIDEEELRNEMRPLPEYPPFFDDYLQQFINEIAVEVNDSIRINLCRGFTLDYPVSRWQDTNSYFKLLSMLNLHQYDQIMSEIETLISEDDNHSETEKKGYGLSPVLAFHISTILSDPNLRSSYNEGMSNLSLLEKAVSLIENGEFPADEEKIKVLYRYWGKDYWQGKKSLHIAKIHYHKAIAESGFIGSEEMIAAILKKPCEAYRQGVRILQTIDFPDNDFGEKAELAYWQGRYAVLLDSDADLLTAAEHFINSLIAGAPRKRFDKTAYKYLAYIHKKLGVSDDLMTWSRKIKDYHGPVFTDITEEAGFSGLRFRRISIGDYNNDGKPDLLFNGHRLYRNEGGMHFTEVTDEAGIVNHSFTGGLWADYDKDGLLDFVALSSSLEDPGDTLFRNLGDGRFEKVNDGSADLNNYSPTEGAAWIDFDRTGYPSLYTANYEVWQVQTGYQDNFRYNDKGHFFDKTAEFGFLKPAYTTNPGLAGRGVAPADYNNDGIQSILVTNYRLNRNFLWEYMEDGYIDKAALQGIAGHKYRMPGHYGYYGHSIGADWGDFNNNGRLDLIIANLAHPRFIEFSDISMLLRNDGTVERTIGDSTVVYQQFTDVTQKAGIAFDELHSDPTWFDAVNNSYLDLYITSVYENDRSYLYQNNQDGTFTDITWLSGTRVYNGWGNAVADLNNNGRLDLVVGSGNGVRIFRNDTVNNYRSVFYKPYWDGEEVKLTDKESHTSTLPNSPAFGTRVELKITLPDNTRKRLIRELSGGKGTTSQNDQFLHFGIRDGTVIEALIWSPER